MIGFWFLEVSSLLFVYMLISYFPLGPHVSAGDARQVHDRRPRELGRLVRTPLQYLAYFPAAVFLGKIHGPKLIWGLSSNSPGSCFSSSSAASASAAACGAIAHMEVDLKAREMQDLSCHGY